MQMHFEIKEFVVAKVNPWIARTVSIQGFNRPIKVEYLCKKAGREVEDVREDVVKQVVNWLREGTPVVGASDWRLKAVWTAIL